MSSLLFIAWVIVVVMGCLATYALYHNQRFFWGTMLLLGSSTIVVGFVWAVWYLIYTYTGFPG